MRPQPVIESTLFFLKSMPIPPACFLTILSLRASIAGQLTLTSFTSKPNSSARWKLVVDIGVVQKNLGGNAADVQAGAAEKRILFDDGGLQSPLARANRGDVSAGSAPDDHEIIFGQTCSPLFLLLIDGKRALILLGRTLGCGSSSRRSRIKILAAAGSRRNRAAARRSAWRGQCATRNIWCAG